MPTILELIRAEKQAQDEEEARPPIRDVESGRALIADTNPAAAENVTLEMCVLRIEEFEKMFRLELIERDLETQGETMLNTFDSLDVARRSKVLFQLIIWKNRNADLNRLAFRRGFSNRFEKVHSLRLLYGNPSGSMQIRQLLRADPLPLTCTEVDDRHPDLHQTDGSSRIWSSEADPRTPTQEESAPMVGGPLSGTEEASSVVAPVAKTSAKRKVTKDSAAAVAPRKARKANGKTLCFESPVKPAGTADTE